MKIPALVVLLAGSALSFAQAPAAPGQSAPTSPAQNQPPEQQRPQREGRRGGGQGFGRGVGGAIQTISGDTITLTTRDGGTATVKVGADTKFMREGKEAKLSDFKAGDRIIVRGESTGTNAWKAEMIGMFPAGGFRGAPESGGGIGPNMELLREGLGKEFVAGEVKAIDGTKLTVLGPDGKEYTAEVDENTSFKKGRESITFPDIKVGDRVLSRGKLNSAGVFVAESLNVGGGFVRSRPEAPQQSAPPKK